LISQEYTDIVLDKSLKVFGYYIIDQELFYSIYRMIYLDDTATSVIITRIFSRLLEYIHT